MRKAVRIRRVDVHEPRHARLEHRPERRQARRAHRRERQPMIGPASRDNLDLVGLPRRFPIEAGRLDRRIRRLCAAAREIEGVDRRIDEAAQPLGERDRLIVRRSRIRRRVGQRGHLIARGVRELRPAVADVDVPQPGQPVEILAAVSVRDDRASSFDPDPGPRLRSRVLQWMKQMLAVGGERGEGHGKEQQVVSE